MEAAQPLCGPAPSDLDNITINKTQGHKIYGHFSKPIWTHWEWSTLFLIPWVGLRLLETLWKFTNWYWTLIYSGVQPVAQATNSPIGLEGLRCVCFRSWLFMAGTGFHKQSIGFSGRWLFWYRIAKKQYEVKLLEGKKYFGWDAEPEPYITCSPQPTMTVLDLE